MGAHARLAQSRRRKRRHRARISWQPGFRRHRARYCSTKHPHFGPSANRCRLHCGGGRRRHGREGHRSRSRAESPIAILPLGSANNIARSVGIEADPIEIARAGWRETEVRRLDVGTAAGPWGKRPFVEAVGVGALAEAWPPSRTGGRRDPKVRARAPTLVEVLAAAQPNELRFAIDGQEVESAACSPKS